MQRGRSPKHRHPRWRTLLLLSCVLSSAAHADTQVMFANRSAGAVLEAYEGLGFAFIYSNDVLPAQRVFPAEPAPGPPITRLREALQALGVTLRVADHNRRWLIVPAGRGERSSPASAVAAPARAADAPAPAPLEELVVVGSRYAMARESTGAAELDAQQLEALPELGDDSLRAVNHLPGVASLGLSAQSHIRGGDVDETLVLLDGMELLAPYHLRSFNSVFSGLHPGTIDKIDVYTGAFPARFGGRLGAVLDIETRTDLPDAGAEFSLSPFTTAGVTFGTWAPSGSAATNTGDASDTSATAPAATAWQWLVAARRGNVGDVLRAFDPSSGAPDYADGYAEVRWQRDASRFAAGVLAYDDDTRLREYGDDGRGARVEADDRNRYSWVRLETAGEPWTSLTRLYVADVQRARRGATDDEDADESVGTLDERARFRRWSLEQQFDRPESDANASALALGLAFRHEIAVHRVASSVERGELAELLSVPTEALRMDRVSLERDSLALWGTVRTAWTPAFGTELGLRVEGEQHPGDGPDDFGISPRVHLRYALADRTQVRLAAGRYRQPQGLHELQLADGERQLQRAQVADHLVLGFEHRFATWNAQVRAEAFAKRISNPRRRYENLFDALQLVPELGPDRIRVDSEKARARGIELQLNVQPSTTFGAWISYSGARSEDRVDGAWTPRTWEQRHTVQLGALWTPARWTVAAGLTWHNGWRTTRLRDRIDELGPQPLRRNASPLPDYLSIDLRVSRMWVSNRQTFILFGEITNLTNHHNVGATNYGFASEDDAQPIVLDVERERIVPLVPSIGFVWRFQ